MKNNPPSPSPLASPSPSTSSSSPTKSTMNPPTSTSSPPTCPLPTPLAAIYSYAHPAVPLALLAFRFPSLIADPVAEMLNAVPFLVALQVVFVIAVLPAKGEEVHSHATSNANSPAPGTEKEKKGNDASNGDASGGAASSGSASTSTTGRGLVLKPGKTGYRKKAHAGGAYTWGIKILPAFISLVLTFTLATPILSILLILFGAPITTHGAQTALCAAHMALLTATPLVYVHGVDGAVWKEVWGMSRPADLVWGGSLGACVGAWLGAVPIPLDWDRPWQAYPITILTGAYLGYAAGSLLGRAKGVYGKRIQVGDSPSGSAELEKEKKAE